MAETLMEEQQVSQINPLVKDSLNVDASLQNPELPERDREKLKLLREELLRNELSKHRKKKLWKEIDWVINRKRRNNHKKQERKKRRLEIQTGIREPTQKKARIVRLADSECKIKVALDLSLHDLMTDAEKTKTGKQMQRCYAINRRRERPLQLYLTGLRNAGVLTDNLFGIQQWDVFRAEEDHVEHFGKDKVVYLTGDSENELQELCEDEAYIIGAMVDHNRHKGITHKRAVETGIRHARLPLDKYIEMKSRKVLTVDQCFQILLNRVNGLSWQDSIIQVIPARKEAQVKSSDDGDENDVKDGRENNEREEDGKSDVEKHCSNSSSVSCETKADSEETLAETLKVDELNSQIVGC